MRSFNDRLLGISLGAFSAWSSSRSSEDSISVVLDKVPLWEESRFCLNAMIYIFFRRGWRCIQFLFHMIWNHWKTYVIYKYLQSIEVLPRLVFWCFCLSACFPHSASMNLSGSEIAFRQLMVIERWNLFTLISVVFLSFLQCPFRSILLGVCASDGLLSIHIK